MGSIDDEMKNIEIPPTLQPIGKEMSSEEKIPEIEGISSMGSIPLSFEAEPSWKRSHTISGNVMSGHAIHGYASHSMNNVNKNGHVMSGHEIHSHVSHSVIKSVNKNGKKLVLANGINDTIANARRRGKVFVNLRDCSKRHDVLSFSKPSSFKFGKRKKAKSKDDNSLLQRANKDKKAKNTAQPTFNTSSKLKKKVFIPPPKPIDPIQPLLEKFEKEKAVGDITEHTLDFENIKPHEAIDKHLLPIISQPKIGPIKEHLLTDQLDTIEPIAKHQVKANA